MKKNPGPELHELADQALTKADAIRVVRHHLRQQGREPETAEIAAILATTQWTTGDMNKDKNYISSTLTRVLQFLWVNIPAADGGRRLLLPPPVVAFPRFFGCGPLRLAAGRHILQQPRQLFLSICCRTTPLLKPFLP